MDFQSFTPPRRVLMGPGPSDVPARVLEAMARPTIGHLDPRFVRFMDSLKELLRTTFCTDNEFTFPVSGPGSVGMETCFVNLVEPGDTVVVCRNGVFGGRMKENAERCGASVVVVEDPWGEAVQPEKLTKVLDANPKTRIVAFVHGETSTGVLSDAAALVGIAREHGCLTIVDAVTSLGGVSVGVNDWGADAVYSGSQKCLSCTPGLSPVTFSPRAMAAMEARPTRVQSWFMDMSLVRGYWGEGQKRSYHHTAPINPLYGLHEALLILHEEGLERSWARHRRHHEALKAGLETMGLEMAVKESIRLPQLNAVRVPDGADEAAVRGRLLEEHGLEIGAGLGEFAGKVWRIGLMGHSARRENVLLCLSALEHVLGDQGVPVRSGGVRAAEEVLRV